MDHVQPTNELIQNIMANIDKKECSKRLQKNIEKV